MSGDVQPRKRKDKKKKKDDLGIEEPRGTAAALGEGDIFMHSQHEHGTGGHWCAKVIFFSLLAVLITLVGLIILENRGLSELEANSVESKYSGVLEGWLEDGHDDDHHDEHTLELNHHDDEDDDDHSTGLDHDDHDEGHDDDEELSQENDVNEDDDENQDDSNEDDENSDEENEGDEDQIDQGEDDDDSQEPNDDQDQESDEKNIDTEDEDEVEEPSYRRYQRSVENQADDDDDDDEDDDNLQNVDDNDDEGNDHEKVDDEDDQALEDDDNDQQDEEDNDSQENENNDDDDDQSNNYEDDQDSDENDQVEAQENENEAEDDHEEQEEAESEVEVEHIEREVFDDDVSTEAPEPDNSEEGSEEASPVDEADDDDEVEFLEPGDDDLPDPVPIPVTKGRPLVEVEDTTSTEVPADTLADEEEYEKQQEELRKEKEKSSQGMWLKVVVGGALLVATQAVLRRATAPREDEVDTSREETPLSDRRMTLIAEPVPPTVTSEPQEAPWPFQKDVRQPVVSAPPPEEEDVEEEEEEEEELVVSKKAEPVSATKEDVDKELFSDEEDVEDEEEELIEEKVEPPKPTVSKFTAPIKEPPKPIVKETPKLETKEAPKPAEKEPSPEEEYDDDDVEIIEEEDIGEELEEEEEDISDVDDAELLHRLEAKYGRLPDPERPGYPARKKDGGNSIEDEWPGEPSDAYWRDELDQAERDLRHGAWAAAAERASDAQLRSSARARYVIARAHDAAAEAKRDNALLTKAIAAYLELLKMNERLTDKKLVEVADRTLDRIKFRGNYLGAEPIYRLLIRRFPDDPTHRNNLTVSFLMANRVDLAEEVIKETLKRWPNDRVALAHHGFILKTLHNRLEEAIDAFTKALEGDAGPANEPRFYYHLGDSLLLLGRFEEAHELHKRGAKLGHFLSPAQRSLYNVERLKSKPWWDAEKTLYSRLARSLQNSWKEILKEGRAAQELYEKEKEGLKERGEWSQLDLFVRGREVPDRCSRAPVTCGIVRSEAAAAGCRRGQVKFSLMEAGTHVRPHVGPTNCRLRMHLGLSNTKNTFIRVDQETRQWQTGKVLMFDDSFEHEVWHNGTGPRLVLIVDVWHPDLTPNERRQLPAI